jgi:ribonuclease P protein component
MRKSLTKNEIVKRQPEIDRIFKTGRKWSCPGLKLVVARNQLGLDRIVVIPVRHYGNAVQRNRIRRQIKEIWRKEKPRMIPGYDFAFVVYPGKVPENEIQTKQLISLCEKAGVYLRPEGPRIV